MNTPKYLITTLSLILLGLLSTFAQPQANQPMTLVITGDLANTDYHIEGNTIESKNTTETNYLPQTTLQLQNATGYLYIYSRNPQERGKLTIDLSIFKNFPIGAKQRPGATIKGGMIDSISATVQRKQNNTDNNTPIILVDIQVQYK